ncbi:MAG: MATE family efflux transporter [Kiritimatiellota bacterium]|nr:MATE family efflux transporter [Kiritimatiellota bacterium]
MNSFFQRIIENWRRPSGYREVFKISLPLIISMSSHTVMLFTDRLFLGRYSLDTLAASVPAGSLAFMFMCFFMGIVEFTNTFVAQYVGAHLPRRVGSALWQGIYLALAAGILLAGLSFFGESLFRLAGHAPRIQELETVYFRILMLGAVFGLLQNAMSCFFSGRGFTATIMVVNVIGVTLNVPLNYLLINGCWGFPELGMAGSALATVASSAVMLLLYIGVVFREQNNRVYGVRRMWAFDRVLFGRLLKFGTPAGIQFFVDFFGFTIFLLMVGRLGRDALAATNIACSINLLAFMPMVGFSIAVSTLVGQAIGRGYPDDGVIATRSALHLTCAYMWALAALFVLAPEWLINIFQSPGDDAGEFATVRRLTVVVLRFIAFYSIIDAINVIYSGALRGAGDTKFIGWTIACLSLGLIVLPVTAGVIYFHAGLYTVWGFLSAYVCVLALVFRWRYRQGRWKRMRVIEPVPAPLALAPPTIPGAD